ncbi:MAG: M56 family metallopeptidase [Isosphaeraceae bacterium]
MEYLVHSVLSNALVATGLALVPLALGRMNRSPALVHALWLVVLIKLLTPPILPFSVVLPAQPVAAADDRTPVAGPRPADKPSPAEDEPEPAAPVLLGIAESPRPDEASPVQLVRERGDEVPPDQSPRPAAAGPDALARFVHPRWETIAMGAMLIGCVGFWSVSAARVRRVHRLVCGLRPAPAELEERVAAVAHRLGLKRAPVVALAPGRIPPMLWALGPRTRLLLPADLWGMLSEGEQTALLAHELAHLKRKDHWVRWLDLVVAGLYWWHPVVWLARRGMREAEELCCDAWAVWAVPRGSRAYASAAAGRPGFRLGLSRRRSGAGGSV